MTAGRARGRTVVELTGSACADPDAEILRDISFSLQPGSFYFLTGASGVSKTRC